MASPCPVRCHKNGPYYVARWKTSDGQPRSRSLGRVSRRQAEKRCWDIAAEFAIEPGRRDAAGAPTLGDWQEQYPKARDDLKASTASMHDRTFRYLIEFVGDGIRLDKFTHAQAEDFKLWLGRCSGRQAAKLSPQTVASHIRNAKVIFSIAKRRRMIGANPFDDISGAAPKVDKQWAKITRADLERILEACPDRYWRCLFALARLAGLRRGEAVGLQWSEIDWNTRRMRPSGKTGPRTVPIEPRLMEILRESWEAAELGETGVCGPLGVGRPDLHRPALAILESAGVGEYAKPFHTLRKNLENEWKQLAPWPTVCSWLGHSAKVAMEHYLEPENDEYERITGRSNVVSERLPNIPFGVGDA